MIFSKVVKIITFVPRKLYNITNNINTVLEAPTAIGNKMSDFEKWATKIVGTTTASGMLGRGAADAAEAYACNDGFCFYLSCIGITAESFGMIANFVPGPNITQVYYSLHFVKCLLHHAKRKLFLGMENVSYARFGWI